MSRSWPEGLMPHVRAARRIVVLSGAGMSAESGVPVFRGPGGLWEGHRAEELATPDAFNRDPATVWRWYRWRLDKVRAVSPHAGYDALTRLRRAGVTLSVVTQNVDGLHERAGHGPAIELHGTILTARCTRRCGATVAAETVDPEACTCVCGAGRLRPDVVWFGEGLDPERLDAARQAIAAADMVWVVGTSGLVYPAAGLPAVAHEQGIPVLEINPESTPLSVAATWSLRDTSARVLPELVRAMECGL